MRHYNNPFKPASLAGFVYIVQSPCHPEISEAIEGSNSYLNFIEIYTFLLILYLIVSSIICPVISLSLKSLSLRSFKFGLTLLIKSSFFSLLHPLICHFEPFKVRNLKVILYRKNIYIKITLRSLNRGVYAEFSSVLISR